MDEYYQDSKFFDPEDERFSIERVAKHRLTHIVAEALSAVLIDPQMEEQSTEKALDDFVNEHEAIRVFLNPLPKHLRRRTTMPLPPRLTDKMVEANRELYSEAIYRLSIADEPHLQDKLSPVIATLREACVATFAKQFADTKNPFYLWRAYRVCRMGTCPLPEWVLNYLDTCAAGLDTLIAHEPEDLPAAILQKIGLHSGTGRSTKLTPFSAARFHRQIYFDVERLIAAGQGVTEAIEVVASQNTMYEVGTITRLYQSMARKHSATATGKARGRGRPPKATCSSKKQ